MDGKCLLSSTHAQTRFLKTVLNILNYDLQRFRRIDGFKSIMDYDNGILHLKIICRF